MIVLPLGSSSPSSVTRTRQSPPGYISGQPATSVILPLFPPAVMNSQQEAFRRFAQQLQRASLGGGGFPGGSPRGLFAGGGLLITLIAGGLALNASLFNGKHTHLRVSWIYQTK
jgi:hypothetical protein